MLAEVFCEKLNKAQEWILHTQPYSSKLVLEDQLTTDGPVIHICYEITDPQIFQKNLEKTRFGKIEA